MKKIDLNEIKRTLKITDYPVQLIIEAIGICNLSCSICPYPKLKREKGTMSDKLYRKIIDEISVKSPEGTYLWFAFMGEPTLLGKKLFEMIKYAKDKGIKHTCLNTNGNLMSREISEWIIYSGLDQIYFSVDAFTENIYKKVRNGVDYHKVKDGILLLLKEIKTKKLDKPEVIVQFIITEDNAGEEEDFKKFWLSRGATVKIRRRLGWGGEWENKELNIPQAQRDMPCPWLVRQMIILWDGRVAQCDADYEGLYCQGNINEQTIYEVWNGELKEKRERHCSNNFDFKPCDQCKDWQVGLSEIYRP